MYPREHLQTENQDVGGVNGASPTESVTQPLAKIGNYNVDGINGGERTYSRKNFPLKG